MGGKMAIEEQIKSHLLELKKPIYINVDEEYNKALIKMKVFLSLYL